MALKAGDHVLVESESTQRSARAGVIEEVLSEEPRARYRIKWNDGRESIYTPAAGAMQRVAKSGKRSKANAK